MRNLSATRWSTGADSIQAVWSSYEKIVKALEELQDADDTQTKSKAKNLLQRVRSFEFIVMVMFVDTLEAVQATIATLCYLRDDKNDLDNQTDAAVDFSERYGIDAIGEYQRHHRSRRPPRRVDERPETATNLDLKDFDRKEFIQILDVQICTLSDNVKIACGILAPVIGVLLPPYDKDLKPGELASFVKMLSESLQPGEGVLNVELSTFRHHCQANKPDVKTIGEAARCAKELHCVFPLTSRCYHLILTAPITSASSESSFPKLKLIKTFLRSVMKQDGLKDLLILGCEKDMTESIDLEKTC